MVASIAPEPIASVAASDYRARTTATTQATATATSTASTSSPLPPILTPVPTPVPVPIIGANEAFAASLIAQDLPASDASAAVTTMRAGETWQAPESSLRLTDLQV